MKIRPLTEIVTLLVITTLFTPIAVAAKGFEESTKPLPMACATRDNVSIRDFNTLEIVGRLDKTECMELRSQLHPDLSIRAQYLTVYSNKTKTIRLLNKKYVIIGGYKSEPVDEEQRQRERDEISRQSKRKVDCAQAQLDLASNHFGPEYTKNLYQRLVYEYCDTR
jgi:hypothetical protein